jgi:serine protease AprX
VSGPTPVSRIRTTSQTLECPLCAAPTNHGVLREAGWLPPGIAAGISREHPQWEVSSGACPACVQRALLQALLEQGDAALHESIQTIWPLDAEAAFGALPTPLRMHADPRYTGRGVTVALIDAGFYPHPDLVQPLNRIKAWADASTEIVISRHFGPRTTPHWPAWSERAGAQWHGMMTSAAVAGNGWLSHGLYCGLAREAELVLIQVRDETGHISSASIVRALDWLLRQGPSLGVRLVSISVAGDPTTVLKGNVVDEAVHALVAAHITVIAASGNDGARKLIPPATAPDAITVGGLDDHNVLDHAQSVLWHSNYGESGGGLPKPELVAPSLWVVAPVLPGSTVAAEAKELFDRRAEGDPAVAARIAELKLVTPYYQHVEGTSFAAPLVSSVVACMLEANPNLNPMHVRDLLQLAARPVPGAPPERQGAGALDAGMAVALALEAHSGARGAVLSPRITSAGITFLLHDRCAKQVQVLGSWDDWRAPGLIAQQVKLGVWHAARTPLPPGRYAYRFILDGARWLDDPANPQKVPNGAGDFDSLLVVPAAETILSARTPLLSGPRQNRLG